MSLEKQHLPYITGLRGIAILMIVLFHLSPQNVSNGYWGVEIFLVISGFLLFRGRDAVSPFQLIEFNKKKILRIYPALSVVVVLAILSSIPFLYDAGGAAVMGNSGAYSLLGVSNYYYMRQYSDYFATDSNLNPLLHTWYLSVTIQIYLIWGLLHALLKNTFLGLRKPAIILLAVGSMLYYFSYDFQLLLSHCGLGGWGQKAPISYYDTIGRIWQVLVGGLVFLLPTIRNPIGNTLMSLSGILFLCFIAFCNKSLPNWTALAVVISTALILKYSEKGVGGIVLNSKILQFLGNISFSLYLLHFPIIAFYRRWEKMAPTTSIIVALLLLSIFAAWIFRKIIEKRYISPLMTVSLMVSAFIVSGLTRGANKVGFRWEQPEYPYPSYKLTHEHHSMNQNVLEDYNEKLLLGDGGTQELLGFPYQQCFSVLSLSGARDKPQFVLVGNSNAQHFYAGFHEICKERNIPGVHLTSIIWPMWDYRVWLSPSYCWTKEKAHAFLHWLKQHPDLHTVVMSHLWQAHARPAKHHTNWEGQEIFPTDEWKLQAVKQFCLHLQQIGKHVVILTPSPVFSDFADRADLGTGTRYMQWRKLRGWVLDSKRGDDPFVITKKEYMDFNTKVFHMLNRLEQEGYCKLLHIEDGIFSEGNFCGVRNGTLYCRDKTHITPPASIFIMHGVADAFERIIQANKDTPPPFFGRR